jgi:hypothetical protein
MTSETRKAPIAKPTEERTADQSTPSASGLTAGRDAVHRERDQDDRNEDVAARTGRGEAVPRRYEEHTDDDIMPSDDSSLKTRI